MTETAEDLNDIENDDGVDIETYIPESSIKHNSYRENRDCDQHCLSEESTNDNSNDFEQYDEEFENEQLSTSSSTSWEDSPFHSIRQILAIAKVRKAYIKKELERAEYDKIYDDFHGNLRTNWTPGLRRYLEAIYPENAFELPTYLLDTPVESANLSKDINIDFSSSLLGHFLTSQQNPTEPDCNLSSQPLSVSPIILQEQNDSVVEPVNSPLELENLHSEDSSNIKNYRAALYSSVPDYDSYEELVIDYLGGHLEENKFLEGVQNYCSTDKAKYFHNKLFSELVQKAFNAAETDDNTKLDVEFLLEKFNDRGISRELSPCDRSLNLISHTLDDSDEDVNTNTKRGKKRQVKVNVIEDYDDDEDITFNTVVDCPKTIDNTSNITEELTSLSFKNALNSDDEEDNSCLFLDNKSSSNSTAEDSNETKTIDVKSTGLLKTTFTINRHLSRDSHSNLSSTSPTVKSSSSFLNQLDSDTPISLSPADNRKFGRVLNSQFLGTGNFTDYNIHLTPLPQRKKKKIKKSINKLQKSPIVKSEPITSNVTPTQQISADFNPLNLNKNFIQPCQVVEPAPTLLKQCLTSPTPSIIKIADSSNNKTAPLLSRQLQVNKLNNKRQPNSLIAKKMNHISKMSYPAEMSLNSNSPDPVTFFNDDMNNDSNDSKQSTQSMPNIVNKSTSLLSKEASKNEHSAINAKIIELLRAKSSNATISENNNQLSLIKSNSKSRRKSAALESLLCPSTNANFNDPSSSQHINVYYNDIDIEQNKVTKQVDTKNHDKMNIKPNKNQQHKNNVNRNFKQEMETIYNGDIKHPIMQPVKSEPVNSLELPNSNNFNHNHDVFEVDEGKMIEQEKRIIDMDSVCDDISDISFLGFNGGPNGYVDETSDDEEEDCQNVVNFQKFDHIITDDSNNHEGSIFTLSHCSGKDKKKVSKQNTFFDEVALPDNLRLGFRISEIAARFGFSLVDSNITLLCNIGLKNFIKKILTQLIASRSAFLMHNNRVRHHLGIPLPNPYLRTSDRSQIDTDSINKTLETLSMLSNGDSLLNSKLHQNFEYSIFPPNRLDSKFRQKKYGVGKNELTFTSSDQVTFDSPTQEGNIVSKFRSNSGILCTLDETANTTLSCNLRHLYNILTRDRSLIPVQRVWSQALYRTIAAFNNEHQLDLNSN